MVKQKRSHDDRSSDNKKYKHIQLQMNEIIRRIPLHFALCECVMKWCTYKHPKTMKVEKEREKKIAENSTQQKIKTSLQRRMGNRQWCECEKIYDNVHLRLSECAKMQISLNFRINQLENGLVVFMWICVRACFSQIFSINWRTLTSKMSKTAKQRKSRQSLHYQCFRFTILPFSIYSSIYLSQCQCNLTRPFFCLCVSNFSTKDCYLIVVIFTRVHLDRIHSLKVAWILNENRRITLSKTILEWKIVIILCRRA